MSSPERWCEVLKEGYLAPSSYDGKPWKVKIINLIESTRIREIESTHIGKFIQVEAIVTTTSIPEATITTAIFKCEVCGEKLRVEQDDFEMKSPKKCGTLDCKNRKYFKLIPEECTYTNTQLLYLQERPEELPPGEIPEPLVTILRGDLIRSATPGDRIKVVGVIKVKPTKRNSLDFMKILEANSVDVLNRNNIDLRLTEERIQQIKALSQQPNLENTLIDSYCPSIYGWRHVKKAALRCLFGGVDKWKEGSFVRGWIHCLLPGDPGLAKTAILLFGKAVSQRGVYDTGRGVTGVGLTAALVKENDKFMLSAGTLARGDRGNVFLDEFEKMRVEDREVIHVPMENGIITITKGGLTTELNSRCSILAAMNPVDGRYNILKTLKGNIRRKPEDFPDSLISRFDLIFIMADEVNKERDIAIAGRMLKLEKNKPEERISFDLLKDYIAYSKHFNPTIPEHIRIKIQGYYDQKRQEMKNDLSKTITPRQIETMERLVEARARMHLREEAVIEDYEDSMWLYEIYINETWKDPYTGEVDTGPMVGIPETSLKRQAEYVPRIIEQIYRDGKGQVGFDSELYVRRGDLVDELVASGRVDKGRANDIIKWAIDADLVWEPRDGGSRIKLTGDRNKMLGDDSQTLNTG